MDLDEANQIIFEHLLANARTQISDLARILKMTKAAVIKRVRFLEQNEYIMRYDAIINWQKLPFIKKTYFVKVDHKEEEKFKQNMLAQQPVFSLIFLSGLYNYQVWCFFKTKSQQKLFENSIKKFEYTDITIEELMFPRVSFFNAPLRLPLPKIKDKELRIGKIDIALMKYMAQGHGRDSFYEMSKQLKINYDAVHYHGKNLIKAGYFLALVAQPGTNKFTLQTTVLVMECTNKAAAQVLYKKLQTLKDIRSNAIAGTKVMIHFLSQTHGAYRETLSQIYALMPRNAIKNTLVAHWDKIILNNRYPLEYFIEQ